MKQKILAVLIAAFTVVIFSASVYAATPKVPLANITVYKLLTNVGYSIDTRRPAAMTPDGCPIYGTGLPLNPLIQSNEFANTLVIADRSGSKILGVKLFFNARGNKSDMVNVISKFVKALDESIYQEMGQAWVDEQLVEFLTSAKYNSQNMLIGLKKMNHWYKFSRTYANGGSVLTVNIEAQSK